MGDYLTHSLLKGYKRVMENCMENAKVLRDGIKKMGRFHIVSRDIGVPVVAFSLKDSTKYSVFDISDHLRKFGWIIPAYTMPPDAEHIAVLRVVIREDFSRTLTERLVSHIQQVLVEKDVLRAPTVAADVVASADYSKKGIDEVAKQKGVEDDMSQREIQEKITKHWKTLVDGNKKIGVC